MSRKPSSGFRSPAEEVGEDAGYGKVIYPEHVTITLRDGREMSLNELRNRKVRPKSQ